MREGRERDPGVAAPGKSPFTIQFVRAGSNLDGWVFGEGDADPELVVYARNWGSLCLIVWVFKFAPGPL